MNKAPLALALAAAYLIAGCATTGTSDPAASRAAKEAARTKRLPMAYPSSAKGWHGIDSVEFVQKFALEDYANIVVLPLDKSQTKLPPSDENTYPHATNILQRADEILLSEIKKRAGAQIQVLDTMSAPSVSGRTLLLRARVPIIEPGSQALRYWVGFGAGSAYVRFAGELVDAQSNAILLKFEHQRIAAMGAFGGAYEGKLNDCAHEVASDIGEMISLFGLK